MAGIDSIINNRADAFAGNPNGLMQRYAMSQDLLDLLALQKLKQDKEAAARSLQMQMQGPQGTVKDQLEGQVMDMTRNEVARAVAPGIQQQGQRMAAEQMQEAMSAGLPTQPAPALQGMAEGGIVGYAGPEGSQVEDPNRIVGYTPAGTPITLADYERSIAALESAATTRNDIPRHLDESLARGLFRGADNAREYAISDLSDAIAASEKTRGANRRRGQDELMALDALRSGAAPTGGLASSTYAQSNPRPRYGADQARTQSDIAGLEALLSGARASDPREVAASDRGIGAPTRTPAAPAPAREYSDAEINSGIAAMLGEDVRPMRREAPAQTEQPKFRSRYEDRLAAIEAEKQDKMGALIDFLLAAGASGGTNLGATLTGGGAGLQARDARLKQEEEAALKGAIEDENAYLQRMFNEEQLRQQADLARLNRESQEREGAADRAAQAEQARLNAETQKEVARLQNSDTRTTDEERQINAYVRYFKTQNPNISDVDAEYLAYQTVAEENIAATTARLSAQQGLTREAATKRAEAIVYADFRNTRLPIEEQVKKIEETADILMGIPTAASTAGGSTQSRRPLTDFQTGQ